MEDKKAAPTDAGVYAAQHPILWDRVQTLDDLKRILAALDMTVYAGSNAFESLRDLLGDPK